MWVRVHGGDARVVLFGHIVRVLRETRGPLEHVPLIVRMHWRLLRVVLVLVVLRRDALVLVGAASRRQTLAMAVLLLLVHAIVAHVLAEVGKGGSAVQNVAAGTHHGNAWRGPGHGTALGGCR